jgi:hypothetical protein
MVSKSSPPENTIQGANNGIETSQLERQGIRRILGTWPVSIGIAIVLYFALIYYAGPWNILANTRLLDLLIDSGVIQYTDIDPGFIPGVASHEYYLASQTAVEWKVLGIVVGLFLLFWGLKSVQFHWLARYHGISGSFGEHASAYFAGLGYDRFLGFQIGDAATVTALKDQGARTDQAHSTLFLANLLIVFEIVVFAIYGIFALGWSAWTMQLFWALVILAIAAYWMRAYQGQGRLTVWQSVRIHVQELAKRPMQLGGLGLISLLAFGLEDIAAYLVAVAFTSEHVILKVDFSILLMGVVGSYIARMIRITPGGIGQFEWGFAAALYIGGLGFPEAATIAILDNLFRYATHFLLWLVVLVRDRSKVRLGQVAAEAIAPDVDEQAAPTNKVDPAPDVRGDQLTNIPQVPLFRMPLAADIWIRLTVVSWLLPLWLFSNKLALLMADYWLLQSMGLSSVFWTNFQMGAILFVAAFSLVVLGVTGAVLSHNVPRRARPYLILFGVQTGLLAGDFMAADYANFLLSTGRSFGYIDPIFGRDAGFYVYTLPTIQSALTALLWITLLVLVVSIGCAFAAQGKNRKHSFLLNWMAAVSTRYTRAMVALTGLLLAVSAWLGRYDLLYKDNSKSAIPTGADYLDVVGLFSYLNLYWVNTVVILVATVALARVMQTLHLQWQRNETIQFTPVTRRWATALALAVVIDFAFAGAIFAKDFFIVRPNEPVVQLPYIQEHIEATRRGYNIENIEEIEFIPNSAADGPLNMGALMSSPTIQNVPLWPTYSNYMEPLIDPDYDQRILQTNGDAMIYGPTLEVFRQQQQLRTYYDFLSVAPLRFNIDGDMQVFAGGVREIPLMEPKPWLSWWGQRYLLYTHGYGMAMAPVSQIDAAGQPVFASYNIPVETTAGELAIDNPRVYYGEGAASMAFSNIRNVPELDYPTEQGRMVGSLPPDSNIGLRVDSPLKRVVFGWLSGQFFEITFSGLITPDTRLHYLRTPKERLLRVAPFLHFDSNIYAVPAEGEIQWLVNGVTTTDRYPYSKHEMLGDKSISRTESFIDSARVNYIEDSVKATVNAYTGLVQLYQISEDPIVATWAEIYPDLFVQAEEMPDDIRQQLTYPLHLFHAQFDDIYIVYHMADPLYFFNMEDMWDDGDEVVGPVLDQGGAITWSIEPYHLVLEAGGLLPESSSRSQFALMAIFTPENAVNLRGLPIAYQDGDDYGKLMVLQVPKGQFVMGPEQADAAIDQHPEVAQSISWWNRRGSEVIRGHTITAIVNNELLYIEPIFIRSQQNPVPQLRRVVVVVREQVYVGQTLEEALKLATDDSNGGVALSQP